METSNNADGLPAGGLLDNRYEIVRELGRGNFGVVYLARDAKMSLRQVVVKVLLAKSLGNEYTVKKFLQEMEAMSRLNHPGIATIFDRGELPDGAAYFVMEYIEGRTLRDAIQPPGVDLELAAVWLRQLGEALSAAHDKGILHRDLKPDNIMLKRAANGAEQPKIVDFGVAKTQNSLLGTATTQQMIVGSPAYMSPEQLSAQKLTPASDVYALGVTAYEMVTGYRPFYPQSIPDLYLLQQGGVKQKPSTLRPDLPAETEAVILKALAGDPNQRYQHADEFGAAFAATLQPPAVLLRPATDPNSKTIIETEVTPPDTARNAPAKTENIASPAPKSRKTLAAGAALGATLLLGGALWAGSKLAGGNSNSAATLSPTPAAVILPPAVTPESAFTYQVEMQKWRNGKPVKEPMRVPGEASFLLAEEDRVRFYCSFNQAGHLYLINEGPKRDAQGLPLYTVLYPLPPAKIASAVQSGKPYKIPPVIPGLLEEGFKVDSQSGAEKIWFIYSPQPLDELEDVARAAFRREPLSAVKDAAQVRRLGQLLAEWPPATATKDAAGQQTAISGAGRVVAYQVELKHY